MRNSQRNVILFLGRKNFYKLMYDLSVLFLDVQVRVLRDYGISTGVRNDTIWSRRDIHVDQDGVRYSMTLWNNQVFF
jgi:hypothetical protein